ncbi:iron chelate uptake ABC transporter family permease subunit [Saxibacter everestensis]|uniref:Iron chelate uptake ABC transporter family permease subunit n=1 Tax=Saxibacter everestensis TaxID=2909229 RepID=A0ABY8QP68_9MICO|nr:iron chelate uptake ABC transporter family permease subunit [Brevibacteriaceae bacterium ZFBP1038]
MTTHVTNSDIESTGSTGSPDDGGRAVAHRTGGLVVRLFNDRLSWRPSRRSLAVGSLLFLACLGFFLIGLMIGDFELSLQKVLITLQGEGSRASTLVVLDWRMPRVLLAGLVGIAFGISGCIFQSISRNALGSPDIIGFTTGAASGALLQLLLFGGSSLAVAGGALVGGLGTAAVVYLLAYKGGVQGYRLVLIGIGVSAVLLSLNSYLIVKVDVEAAQAAATWITGTLNGRGWLEVQVVGAFVVVLAPVAMLMNSRLTLMEMGDDAAKALGVSVEMSRAILILVAVTLTSIGTAAVGPVAFIALAAPQVAKLLSRSTRPAPLTAGLTGAVMLMFSDFAAQHFFETALPTGVLTGAVGGLYLVALLVLQWRSNRL